MAKELNIAGQSFECIDVLPAGILFDLIEAGEKPGARSIVALGKFLRLVVVDEDKERLEELLYDTKSPVPLTAISEGVGALIPEYTNRPTVRPSESADGSEPTGAISKVVSFSQGTVTETPSTGQSAVS
jgi:hypothetical protein